MKRTLSLALAAVIAAVSLTACSESKVASTGNDKEAKTVSGAEAAVEAAKEELAKYTDIPEFEAPNEAFDISSLKGNKLAIVAVNLTTPSLAASVEGVKRAAKAAGLTTTVYDAKNTPSEMTAGVAQGIAAKADGIILVGISVGLINKQLADAKAAGIPTVAVNNNQPDPDAPGQGAGEGVFATAAPDYHQQGVLASKAAIIKTGGNAKAILVTTDGIDPAPPVLSGLEDGLKDCTTCEILDTRSTQLEDWFNGNLASLTTSLVVSHKEANIMLPIFVTMAMFMVPAAQQAGAGDRISFFSTSAPPDAAEVLAANPSLGGIAGMSDENLGWLAVNQAMRGMLDLEPGNPVVPTRYFTAETVKGGTTETDMYGDAFVDGFKKLWGIG